MIKTQTGYISYDQVSFIVPAYSKLLNILYANSQYTILYEYDPEQTETKTFVIQPWVDHDGTSMYYPPYGFNYWGTITYTEPILSSHTQGMGSNTNMTLNLINNTNFFHIFVQEILSTAEMRDKKIEEII